jgi:hypothetical protein
MPAPWPRSTLTIELLDTPHTLSEVASIFTDLNRILAGAVLAAATWPDPADQRIESVRALLRPNPVDPVPLFYRELWTALGAASVENLLRLRPTVSLEAELDGVAAFVQRSLALGRQNIAPELVDFVLVDRIERRSPLLLELSVLLAGIPTIVAGIAFACIKVMDTRQRDEAEREIRRLEAEGLRQDVKFKATQNRIAQEVQRVLEHEGLERVPAPVLVAAMTMAATPVAELSSKPIIGSITLGLSTKG